MFRKILSCLLVFSVFTMSFPAYVAAKPLGDDNGVTYDPEENIRGIVRPIQPIISGFEYGTPNTGANQAVFPFVDADGQLFDINVNFGSRAYSVFNGSQFIGAGTLTNDQFTTLKAIAEDSNLPPDQRRFACELICAILIAAAFFTLGVMVDRAGDQADCQRMMARDDAEALRDAVQQCPQNGTNAEGKHCVYSPQYAPAQPEICLGRGFLQCREYCES